MPKRPYSQPKVNANAPPKGGAQVSTIADLVTMSSLLTRAQLASTLGLSFGGDRDVYEALGYDTTITWEKYVAQYTRQGFARAVIDRPVAYTWGAGFEVVEAGDDQETALEKAWKELDDKFGMTSMFARLDKLVGLGSYGVLLLGLGDVQRKDDFAKPVTGVGHELLYLRPFSGMADQGDAQVHTWVNDPADPRYGEPEMYKLTMKNVTTGNSYDLMVHHSRVIHVADGLGTSEVEGTPRLEAVWNNLKNLEKIIGGSAEMYWRGARPGYAFNVDKDFTMTQGIRDTLKDVFDEYEHNLRRILEVQGGKLEPLAQQLSDPSGAVDVQIQEMSAITGIPKRVFTGSERGELASSQDRDNHADFIEDRQRNFAEPRVIRPTIKRFIELQIMPDVSTPEGWSVRWPDLREPSDMDKAKLWETRASAISKYASSPGSEAVVPVPSFLRMGGFNDDEITLIEEEREEEMKKEEEEQAQAEEEQRRLLDEQGGLPQLPKQGGPPDPGQIPEEGNQGGQSGRPPIPAQQPNT